MLGSPLVVAARAHMHLPIILQQAPEVLVGPLCGVSYPGALEATAGSNSKDMEVELSRPGDTEAAAVAHIEWLPA